MRRLTAAGIIVLGLVLTAGAVALVLASDHTEVPWLAILTQLLSAWSFILGGLFAWARRPDNRFGVLLTAVGFAVFIGALSASNESLPFTLGWTFGGVFIAVFIHALLAFPRGYLETRLVFAIVGVAYGAVTVGAFLISLFDDPARGCPECPDNVFLVVDSPAAVAALNAVLVVVGIPALLASLYIFRRRWRAASAPLRRVLLPVYLTAAATIVLLAVALVVEPVSSRAGDVLIWVVVFVFALVPPAFIVGLLSGRLAREGVGQLVLELGQALSLIHI